MVYSCPYCSNKFSEGVSPRVTCPKCCTPFDAPPGKTSALAPEEKQEIKVDTPQKNINSGPETVSARNAGKTIKETKCICNQCGNIWFYGKQETSESTGNAMQNCGKTLMCCSGCLPAILIPNRKVLDLNKCSKCGSRAIKKEMATYEV